MRLDAPTILGRERPAEVEDPIVRLWLRSSKFFGEYEGERVICGHTATGGKEGGFLTAIELPGLKVYESR